MDRFEIIYPSVALAPFVSHYWILETDGTMPVSERIVATGCMQMIFHRANRIFSVSGGDWQPRSFIGGQTVDYADLHAEGKINMVVVVFQPYGAKAFFRMPMDELRNKLVPLEDMDDRLLAGVEDRILNTPDNKNCIRLIEQYLMKRLEIVKTYNFKRLHASLQAINKQPDIDITRLSEISCLSTKQFNRLFSEYIGANPKEFLRIVRFQRALDIWHRNPRISLTQLALESGYYDHAHMVREFRTFSGYSPSEYAGCCDPYSDYFSEH